MEAAVKIIAELCQNHNGDPELMARMVEAAAGSGATHVKIQNIYANTLAYRPQFEEGYQEDSTVQVIRRPYRAEHERLSGLELSERDNLRFIDLCRQSGVVPMTTCFARVHVPVLRQMGYEAIKVASYDCASYPMLRELAAGFDSLVVSTGATHDDEIVHAVSVLRDTGVAFALLHCVTIYPTPLDEIHLARMQYLGELAPGAGFSDHTLVSRDGVAAAKAAIACGASWVERHFTVLPPDQTRDGPVSIGPELLSELAGFAGLAGEEQRAVLDRELPDWKKMVGQRDRTLGHDELLNRDYYRGRFASPRPFSRDGRSMIFNWEETPLCP